ncbi:MAG: segregation/condensation protein A [Candidatus Pacearchaeota archaeon]
MTKEKFDSEKFFEIISKEDFGWQSLIYELVRTEQLDPWDIDITILADKYLSFIEKMEEMNFFVSSKILLACAILLRMKSEILNTNYIKEVNNLIYGKQEEKKKIIEKIVLEENIPLIVPKTPLPRYKKVTLKDLMLALNKAIESETRRIRRIVKKKQSEKLIQLLLPKSNRIPIKERINLIIKELEKHFKLLKKEEISYSEIAQTKEEKRAYFLPILHLYQQEKIFIKQYYPFEEIFMKLERYSDEEDLERVSEESELDEKKGE